MLDLPGEMPKPSGRSGSRRPSSRVIEITLAFAMLLSACAGRAKTTTEVPVAKLAATQRAKADFHPLRQRWLNGSQQERQQLEPSLEEFRRRHPDDDLAQVAAVYLAFNAIQREDFTKARELITPVLAGPPGATQDFAIIAEASILRREGDAARAHELLAPLVGKVIDPYTRRLLNRELVRAAIQAGRYYEAIGYLDVWLLQTLQDDPAASRREIHRALETIPIEVARAIVRSRAESGYSQELRKALADRLAERQGDASLEPSLRDPAHVDGHTIGLLLSLGSNAQRAKAALALAGVLEGLQLPRDDEGGPRLVTADDGGDPSKTEAALLHLASQGAAITIAGLDPTQAKHAARFAERTSMPLLLLSAPDDFGARPSSAFVMARGEDEVAAKLGDALSKLGAEQAAVVGGDADALPLADSPWISCDDAASFDQARSPLGTFRAAKVESLLLLGSPLCAVDAIDALLTMRTSIIAAASLEAAAHLAFAPPPGVRILVPSAGHFPLREAAEDSPLRDWVTRHGAPPSYFAALARDAAVLAQTALSAVPRTKVVEPGDVAWRYVETAKALEQARADLFTTDARGFTTSGELPREIRIVEVE